MRRFLFALALLCVVFAPTYAHASVCNLALAESLKNTVISIERVLTPNERTGSSMGGLGTGWFLSENRLVTIGHVATAQKLSGSWKHVTLRWSNTLATSWKHSLRTEARIVHVVKTGMIEPLVIVELKDAVPWMHVPQIRKQPLHAGERVIGIAYEGYAKENTVVLIYGTGTVANHSMNWQIPLQMIDKNGHFRAFSGGTSGSPIFDCNGEVVAVMQAMKGGQINNFAVSASPLLYVIPQK